MEVLIWREGGKYWRTYSLQMTPKLKAIKFWLLLHITTAKRYSNGEEEYKGQPERTWLQVTCYAQPKLKFLVHVFILNQEPVAKSSGVLNIWKQYMISKAKNVCIWYMYIISCLESQQLVRECLLCSLKLTFRTQRHYFTWLLTYQITPTVQSVQYRCLQSEGKSLLDNVFMLMNSKTHITELWRSTALEGLNFWAPFLPKSPPFLFWCFFVLKWHKDKGNWKFHRCLFYLLLN